ncbi:hypothetical protein BDZ45DRAFT_725797 [Acephala macrosclerotiorum]|nr:hypothetical protein BDZ45DRAFT_725797 [Acephala macrosclerotiorum]
MLEFVRSTSIFKMAIYDSQTMASQPPVPITRVRSLLPNLSKLRLNLLSGPPTTFTCFPKLPIELRIKMWRNFSSLPRVSGGRSEALHRAREKVYITMTTPLMHTELAAWGELTNVKEILYLVQASYHYDPERLKIHEAHSITDTLGEELYRTDGEEQHLKDQRKEVEALATESRHERIKNKVKLGVIWIEYRKLDFVLAPADEGSRPGVNRRAG